MSLGNAADGGIAGHLRDEIDIEREEGGLQAHSGGSHGRLASGMAGADHNYVELFREPHEERAPQTILRRASILAIHALAHGSGCPEAVGFVY